MEDCSTYRPRCYGVSYDTDTGDCQFKDRDDVSPAEFSSDDNANSAIARITQLTSPSNTSCPFDPNSYQYTTEGMRFEILCNLDMPFGDYRPSNVNYWPYHADSLQECMDLCSTSRPLCEGVSWNPGMEAGFANCYPKSSQEGTPEASNGYVTHSAIWRDDGFNVSCPTVKTYSASNDNKSFEISCNSGRLGGSNTSYHATSLDGCINTCATNSSQNCLGVVYDGSLQGGFSNCYILNATGEPTSIANSTFALFTPSEKTAAGNGTTSSSPQSSHSSSKAWIVGPTIGAVVIIALLAAFLWWRRRKRSPKAEENVTAYESIDYKQLGQSPYQPTPFHEMQASHNYTSELASGVEPPHQQQLYDQGGHAHELGVEDRR